MNPEEFSPRTGPPASGMRELMILPLLMGGLSLLMWFSLPTRQEVHQEYAADIEQREILLRRVVKNLPADGRARGRGCRAPLEPLPMRLRNNEFVTNTDILGAINLDDLDVSHPLRGDEDLYLRGTLGYLMYWRRYPPHGNDRRMGQDRIEEEILQPLATRYLVLYGLEERDSGRSVIVNAFIHDLASGQLLCELRAEYPLPNPAGHFLADLAALTGGTFSDDWDG